MFKQLMRDMRNVFRGNGGKFEVEYACPNYYLNIWFRDNFLKSITLDEEAIDRVNDCVCVANEMFKICRKR